MATVWPVASKSPNSGNSGGGKKKSGGGSIISRMFVLLVLAIAGLCGWYWWQSNDPLRKEPPVIEKYVDVDAIKRAPGVLLSNENWQAVSNRVATNLPWADAKTNNSATPTNQPVRVSTNQIVRSPITNQVTRPTTNQTVVPPAIPIVTSNSTPVTNMVVEGARPVQTTLEAQVALARLGFSPGSVDGTTGYQTRAAIRGFQQRNGIPQSGELDAATKNALQIKLPLYTNYTVTSEDIGGLRALSKTWLGKSQQDKLGYETVLELVAEKFQSYPSLIKQLNQGVNWDDVSAGTVLTVPNITPPKPAGRAAYVSILLSARLMQVFDQKDRLIAQFPCSIAQKVDKRPIGVVRVKTAAENPNYRFNPEIFPESEEAKKIGKPLMIQPGPNNPVGVAWIGLDKPGYGIHGTPSPEAVGKTESHGCFRLANWNAAYLIKMIWVDMPVYVEP
ncbi:MAG TPA: L,D-transpeptidase [Verrucomicrobiae bacterium]